MVLLTPEAYLAGIKYGTKEIRELLDEFEQAGWKVILPPPGTYAKVRCPCGLHQRNVHRTPSDPNYVKNARKWAQRQPCWI